jgi:hypothetical protein
VDELTSGAAGALSAALNTVKEAITDADVPLSDQTVAHGLLISFKNKEPLPLEAHGSAVDLDRAALLLGQFLGVQAVGGRGQVLWQPASAAPPAAISPLADVAAGGLQPPAAPAGPPPRAPDHGRIIGLVAGLFCLAAIGLLVAFVVTSNGEWLLLATPAAALFVVVTTAMGTAAAIAFAPGNYLRSPAAAPWLRIVGTSNPSLARFVCSCLTLVLLAVLAFGVWIWMNHD